MAATRASSDPQLRNGSRSPQQRYRPISQSFPASFRPPAPTPLPPDEAYEKLEHENVELHEDVESLTMMVEKLRSEVERSRIRLSQAQNSSSAIGPSRPTENLNNGRRKSFAFLSPSAAKSTPSPATVSSLDLPPPGPTLRRI